MTSAVGTGKYTPLFFLALVGWLALVWAFVELGRWQVRRAAEKQALMDLYRARISVAPVSWAELGGIDESEARYRRVSIRGDFDASRQILLDNQVWSGQVGYHVLTPFVIEGSGLCILVNRGWIPQGPSRTQLPVLSEPQSVRMVSGVLDRFPSVALKLKGADEPTAGWPAVVQVLDGQQIAARLGRGVFPMQLLMDEGAENGYTRAWRAPNLMPEKNQGYAFQWFSLAALTSGYAVFWVRRRSYRRKPPETDEVENA